MLQPQVNPSDPRVRRTRRLLQQAFTELVHEQSFEAISVRDIAARATLNRATFYAHYTDKYALLDATIGASFAEVLERRIPADTPMEEKTLGQLILAVCEFHQELGSQCKRSYQQLEPLLEPRILSLLQEHVQLSLASTKSLHASGPAALALAATVVSWSIYGAVLDWNKAGRPHSADTLVESILPLIMGSVTALQDR
jgi:AcrR family transcriptional regulator